MPVASVQGAEASTYSTPVVVRVARKPKPRPHAALLTGAKKEPTKATTTVLVAATTATAATVKPVDEQVGHTARTGTRTGTGTRPHADHDRPDGAAHDHEPDHAGSGPDHEITTTTGTPAPSTGTTQPTPAPGDLSAAPDGRRPLLRRPASRPSPLRLRPRR